MDNMSEKSLRILIVIFSLSFLYTAVMRYNENINSNQQKIEIQKLTKEVDSLHDELFIEKVESGRHEITREEILSKYPKVAKEYDEFYSHKTE